MRTEQKMIGYRPTLLEQMKINYIAVVFGLTACGVIRELMNSHYTIDQFHQMAKNKSNGIDTEWEFITEENNKKI